MKLLYWFKISILENRVIYGQDRFSGAFFSVYKNCCQESFKLEVSSMWFLFNHSDVQLSITVKITKIYLQLNFLVVSLNFKPQKNSKRITIGWFQYLFLGSLMMDFAQTTYKRKGLKSFIYFANCEVMSHVNHI